MMDATKTERTWSAQQQAIFSWFATGTGNLVVRARAGTGKTTTLIEAIGHAPERSILLAAFNKRIAEELQKKLAKPGAEAKTLHSLGFKFVLRQWKGARVDDQRGFDLAKTALAAVNRGFSTDKVARLVARLAAKGKNCAPFGDVQDLRRLAITFDLTPDDDQEEQGFTLHAVVAAAVRAMDAAAEPNVGKPASVDFDDMVFVPVRNHWVRGTYDLVCIDEAQDMNAAQLQLAMEACRPGGRMVVVGDDRQAIYGFRGADSQSLDRLKDELHATELGLTTTYRCPKKVVARAQALVPDYQAAPTAPEGVVRSLGEAQLNAAASAGDFVLSRKNAPLVRYCLAMLRSGKRARIEGREIGKGLLDLVRRLKARDLQSLATKLLEWERREATKLVAQCGSVEAAQAKVEALVDTRETLNILSEGLSTVADLEVRIEALFSGSGTDQVVFSTVHKAKGLEADRVFLLEESFVPNRRAPLTPGATKEEANIRYVALTRAKSELVFVHKGEAPEAGEEGRS